MQKGTNEPVAVWYAPDVDIVKAGFHVIVKVFSVVGSFRHLIGLLLSGPDDEHDYETEISNGLSRLIMILSSLTLVIWLLLRKVTCNSNSFTAIFSCCY